MKKSDAELWISALVLLITFDYYKKSDRGNRACAFENG